jgi:hypothetical protein
MECFGENILTRTSIYSKVSTTECSTNILARTGHGTIITGHDKLSHYLSLLTNQFPIESNFIALIAERGGC